MTLETKPAWAVELGKKLSQAYTQEELARLTEWADSIARLTKVRTGLQEPSSASSI
jgi:hypothetical protein